MTDYTELVKALRSASTVSTAWEKLMHDAAAAIEALQAEEKSRKENCEKCSDATRRVIIELQKIIADLRAQLPKRGEWILCGPVGWPNWECSVCHSEGRGDYRRCPWCGAVMDESNASNTSNALNALDNAQDGPIVTPCRGCSDYDGYGGCKSKGGCARAKKEVQE